MCVTRGQMLDQAGTGLQPGCATGEEEVLLFRPTLTFCDRCSLGGTGGTFGKTSGQHKS